MDAHGMDARAIEDLIYRQSGLLGVSGISSDMRTLRASAAPEAAEAIALFVYRIIREIGSLVARRSAGSTRSCSPAASARTTPRPAPRWRGLPLVGLGAGRDAQHRRGRADQRGPIAIAALVVPTDEERMIARHTADLLGLRAHP